MGVGEKKSKYVPSMLIITMIIITVADTIDDFGLNSHFIVKAEFEPLTKRSNWQH